MVDLNPSIIQDNINETIFYDKVAKYISSLGGKFREKSVIKQEIYN
jgi:hypothetical protein